MKKRVSIMKPLVRRTYWSTKFVADSSQREDWLNTSHWEGREDRARWEEESPSSRGPWEALEEHEESASRRLSQAHEVPDRHLLRRLRPEGRRSDEAPAQRLLARGHDDVGRLRQDRQPPRRRREGRASADLGIRGNSHFPFAEKNNVEVAGALEAWLKEKNLDGYAK